MAVRLGRLQIGPKLVALLIGALFGALTSLPTRSDVTQTEKQRLGVQGTTQLRHNSNVAVKMTIDDSKSEDKLKPEADEVIPKAGSVFEFDDAEPNKNFINDKLKVDAPLKPLNAAKPAQVKKPQPKVELKKPKKERVETVPEHLKEDHVVNPHPYNVIASNNDLCKVQDLFLIVYVHTAADHYKRRAIIRQTWGNPENYPGVAMRILFVMGKTSQVPMMQKAIEFESATYKDILEEDFEDTYRNLTYKGIAALKWVSQNCNNARYILKTDDDVFVNMYTIINHLQNLNKAGYNQNMILCLVWWRMHALRDGKWGIPVTEYPDSLYPPYCSGMAYILSVDIAKKLYDVSFYVKFFWVDDVYVSGMLPKAAGLNHTTMIKAYCGKNEMEDLFTHPTEWNKYAFTHIHDEAMFMRTWDRVTAIAKTNPIPVPKKIEPGWLADEYLPKTEVVKNPDGPKKTESKNNAPQQPKKA